MRQHEEKEKDKECQTSLRWRDYASNTLIWLVNPDLMYLSLGVAYTPNYFLTAVDMLLDASEAGCELNKVGQEDMLRYLAPLL